MFEAYTTVSTDYVLDDLVTFNNIRYDDCRVRVTNSSTFTINTPGRYYVFFGGVGSSGTAASSFSVQLFNNDVAVPAVVSEVTSTAADDPQTLGFSTIINVLPSNCYIDNTVRLQVRVTSEVAGAIENANIVIFRLK